MMPMYSAGCDSSPVWTFPRMSVFALVALVPESVVRPDAAASAVVINCTTSFRSSAGIVKVTVADLRSFDTCALLFMVLNLTCSPVVLSYACTEPITYPSLAWHVRVTVSSFA